MERSQESEGVSSSRDSGVCHGSGILFVPHIQLVGKGGTEEEVEDNIPSQEKKGFML